MGDCTVSCFKGMQGNQWMHSLIDTGLHTAPASHRNGKLLLVSRVGGDGAAPPVESSEAKGRKRWKKLQKTCQNMMHCVHTGKCAVFIWKSMLGLRPALGNLKPASQNRDGTPWGCSVKTSRQFLPRVPRSRSSIWLGVFALTCTLTQKGPAYKLQVMW